jgi:hypothetical protein
MDARAANQPLGETSNLSVKLVGGNGTFVGSPFSIELERFGYTEEEFAASGIATSLVSDGELTSDGRWTFSAGPTAPYRTRIVVRRPTDPEAFSGTACVEWLNVSGGLDADPEWASVYEEVLRRGHMWVGVSAQHIGVMGGPVLVQGPDDPRAALAGQGLRAIDPARYGSLDHPGDGYSHDIYTQVGRAIRAGMATGGLVPRRVVAVGESQSAAALVTYYNGVQPLSGAFDGFLVHSRAASALPLVGPGEQVAIAEAILRNLPVVFRTDADAPVMNIQSEGDVTGLMNSHVARQPDSDVFRLWEVAGTSHADAHMLGALAGTLDCGLPINDGPFHLVVKAALRALVTWVDEATAPPTAARLDVVDGAVPSLGRDRDGIATGGIRNPTVDVPVATLSGEPGPSPSMLCLLLGSARPFTDDRINELYASPEDYLKRFETGADEVVAGGFVLPEDREALLAFAEPSVIGPR